MHEHYGSSDSNGLYSVGHKQAGIRGQVSVQTYLAHASGHSILGFPLNLGRATGGVQRSVHSMVEELSGRFVT